jgi:hypothetical protein
MRKPTPSDVLKIATVLGFLAFCIGLFVGLAGEGHCQGQWCPPIDCYGGDCAECVCLRENYPEPGYCVSLQG